MDQWLELIVFGVISIAVWEILRAIAMSYAVASRVASMRTVQQIKWDLIKTREESIRPGTPFSFSLRIFEQIPADLFDDEDAMREFKKIQNWLKEDAYTSATEEIYLVARDRPILGTIRGILYASLDKGPQVMGPNSCFVWYIAVDQALLDGEARLRVCDDLWQELHAIVSSNKTTPNSNVYDYYFEVPKRQEPSSPEWDTYFGLITTFFKGEDVGRGHRRPLARVMDFITTFFKGEDGGRRHRRPHALVMDFPYYSPALDEEAILLYGGKRHPGERHPMKAEETLETIYGLHFWGFTYGIEEKTLNDLKKRAEKFARIKAKVRGQCPGGVIELVEMSDLRAKELGFTWPSLPTA